MAVLTTIVIAGQTTTIGTTSYAEVIDSNPAGTEFGLVTRPIISQPVDVNIVGGTGTPTNTFGDVTLVPYNTPTTVVTYTVPGGHTFQFMGFIAGGTVNAIFTLTINASTVVEARTTVAQQTTEINLIASFPQVPAAQVITVSVTHFVQGVNADFEGTIIGTLA